MSLECKALVAWDVNNTQVETVTVEAPKKNEVRIKIRFSGICHTDLYTLSGEDPEAIFPCILGHEGSGVVESVGPGVDHVQVGDSVICLYIPQCYSCKFCKSSKSNLCSTIRSTQGAGLMPDGTTRFSCRGQRLYHYMGCSAFSQYTVCADISVCKINPEAPLANVCLLGCAVSTGYGAALNTAKVEKDSTCAIFGLGAVGLSVVLGCVRSKAKRIIGIDLNDTRLELGKKLGCTDIINPKNIRKPLQEHLIELTDGGLDFTFECVGNVEVMRTALESCHKGWGVSVIIGVAGKGQEIRTRPFQLVTGRVWKGCAFGGWKSRDDVPKLVDSHCDGQFNFTDLLTDRLSFDQIKLGLKKTENGQCIRAVIDMWQSETATA